MAKMLKGKMKRLEATVYGRVQGVNFRHYTRREANRHHLTGWVANQRDGSVRVVAEGPDDALARLVNFLHHGPPSARVDKVTTSWGEATREYTSFTVRWF